MVHGMPQVVWTATPDGHRDYYNQHWYTYTGMTSDQTMDGGWLQAVHPDDLQICLERWTQAVSTGEPYEIEHRLKRADGEFRWDLARALPQFNETGEIVQWVGTCTDIHDYKQAQADLLKQNDEARLRVNERTKELERSNAELQQFAYVASHDLQEPLRMIASYLELLENEYNDLLNDEGRQYIAYAVDGAYRMKGLINDLLDYSRVGKDLAAKLTDCEFTLGAALHDLQMQIDECGAIITHDPLPKIVADETQFVRLFQNLISNAMKFRGTDSPKIHISAKQTEKEWHFTFRDNGIGVDPKHAERIFVIFQRLHNRDKYPGTGIGLAVCKKIVEFHGGRIWIESTLGKGSAFHFTVGDNTSWHKEQVA